MRVQSKAAATLLFASSSVCAFTGFTSSPAAPILTHGRSASKAKATAFAPHTALYLVVEDDVDTTVEEKAWKIVKERTDDSSAPTEAASDTTPTPTNTNTSTPPVKAKVAKAEGNILDEIDLVSAIEEEASKIVDEMALDFDEECEIDDQGNSVDELCMDESKLSRAKAKLKNIVFQTLGLVRTGGDDEWTGDSSEEFQILDLNDEAVPEGELLEKGWEERGNSNALRRNAEVWKFALSCVFKALKPKKLRKNGATEEEIKQAKTDAATFIRNGLLKLGPSFVKLVSSL